LQESSYEEEEELTTKAQRTQRRQKRREEKSELETQPLLGLSLLCVLCAFVVNFAFK
jgi:hypothetical protein